MKGFAAAIILFILCFNWFGYSTVVFLMQQKADVQLEASLDTKSIKESELFEIKIPLHLPYQTNWANYERYDGEVKLDGTIYKYVKRKVTADTLHLCGWAARRHRPARRCADRWRRRSGRARGRRQESPRSR